MAALFPNAVDRPTDRAPAIRAKAIEKILDDVMKHENIPEDERDQTRKALDDAFEYRTDGYEAAKNLDSYHGWSPDAQLVDTLDMFGCYLRCAHRDAITAWVKEYDIKPAFKVGDRVAATWGGDKIEGTIRGVDTEHATYTVQRPEDEDGSGAIVDFEDTEAS